MGAIMKARERRFLEFIGQGDGAIEEVVSSICEDRVYLPEFCRRKDIRYGEVMNWLMADEARYGRYMKALEADAHSLMTETVAIADEQKQAVSKDGNAFDPDVGRDRLRIDARQKLAKSHFRKMYGEQVEQGKGGVVPVFQVVVQDGGVLQVGVGGGSEVPVGSGVPVQVIEKLPEDI